MRSYSGWTAADLAAFQSFMLNVFYPVNHDFLVRHNNTCNTHYWANWDLCNLDSMLAIGVFCDTRTIYNEAINYFKTGIGNGHVQPPPMSHAFGDGPFEVAIARNVAGHGERFGSLRRGDVLHQSIQQLRTARRQCQLRARPAELPRKFLSDARGGAGNEDDLIAKEFVGPGHDQ